MTAGKSKTNFYINISSSPLLVKKRVSIIFLHHTVSLLIIQSSLHEPIRIRQLRCDLFNPTRYKFRKNIMLSPLSYHQQFKELLSLTSYWMMYMAYVTTKSSLTFISISNCFTTFYQVALTVCRVKLHCRVKIGPMRVKAQEHNITTLRTQVRSLIQCLSHYPTFYMYVSSFSI